MKYLSLAIIPFFIGFLIPLVFSLIKKANLKKESKMNKYDFILCYSLGWAWVSIITSITLSVILVLLNIFGEVQIIVNVIIIPLIVILLFGAYAFIREKIVIKKDVIKFTPVFGKTKTFTFNDIEKIKAVSWSNGTMSYKAYKNKKLFSISNVIPGFNLFVERAKEAGIKFETLDD